MSTARLLYKRTTWYGCCPSGKGVGALDPDGSRCAGAIYVHENARTKKLCNTVCAYIENWLFGFCWASSPSGNGATNTRTGRPEPPCSIVFPRMIPVQPIGAAEP